MSAPVKWLGNSLSPGVVERASLISLQVGVTCPECAALYDDHGEAHGALAHPGDYIGADGSVVPRAAMEG
jgi:hypothetical protein